LDKTNAYSKRASANRHLCSGDEAATERVGTAHTCQWMTSRTCWPIDKWFDMRSVTTWCFPLLYWSVTLWWVDGEAVRRVTEAWQTPCPQVIMF